MNLEKPNKKSEELIKFAEMERRSFKMNLEKSIKKSQELIKLVEMEINKLEKNIVYQPDIITDLTAERIKKLLAYQTHLYDILWIE